MPVYISWYIYRHVWYRKLDEMLWKNYQKWLKQNSHQHTIDPVDNCITFKTRNEFSILTVLISGLITCKQIQKSFLELKWFLRYSLANGGLLLMLMQLLLFVMVAVVSVLMYTSPQRSKVTDKSCKHNKKELNVYRYVVHVHTSRVT